MNFEVAVNKSNPQQREMSINSKSSFSLQLLLFVDNRSSSQEQVQRIETYLQTLKLDYAFDLQITNVSDQPYLAEYFKLVATPALVRIYPEPRQILAGSDIIVQLQKWWLRWKTSAQQQAEKLQKEQQILPAVNYSAEVLRLSDQIFRLQREKEQLKEQLHFKDQVLAMLAHDLRSPLTAVSIAVETLEIAQKQLEPQKAKKLEQQLYKHAKTQFRTMNQMITDILQTSSRKTAQINLRPAQIYLQVLCRDIIEEFRPLLQEKSFQLAVDLPQDLPAVYADSELVKQVIKNLIDNALKYTPEGGELEIAIVHRTIQKIQFTISDNGAGIPEADQEAIFEEHFRLQRDSAKEGYGIGLALCRKVIQAHYGHIWVSSVPNQGSCFHFTLPVYRP